MYRKTVVILLILAVAVFLFPKSGSECKCIGIGDCYGLRYGCDEGNAQDGRWQIQYYSVLISSMVLFMVGSYILIKNARTKGRIWVKASLVLAFLLILVWFVYPENLYKSDRTCVCTGIQSGEYCYGVAHGCVFIEKMASEQAKTCQSDCDSIRKYIASNSKSNSQQAVDLVIIMDKSKSMEGEKITQAKAALKSLVLDIEPENRISLVEFDNTSDIAREFTRDKNLIYESIDSVQPGSSTLYSPALYLAHHNFLTNAYQTNQWQVMFVSDGAPNEDPSKIYRLVEEMAEDDICLSTLGIGSEVISGSKGDIILREMARISKMKTGCGVYHYSGNGLTELTQALGKLYEESYKPQAALSIKPGLVSQIVSSKDSFEISTNLNSRVNNLTIPGSALIDGRRVCSPPAKINLLLANQSWPMDWMEERGVYVAKLDDMPVGNHESSLTVSMIDINGEDCQISDYRSIGNLEVRDAERFEACPISECDQLGMYLFSNISKKSFIVYITDSAFVPQNISISGETNVVWKNIGASPHTVTSGDGVFDGKFRSGTLMPGESYNLSFRGDERIDYFDDFSLQSGQMQLSLGSSYSIGNFSLEYRRNLDLTLLIDESGSMRGRNIEQIKEATRKLVNIAYPGDRIALVTFSDDVIIRNSFTAKKDVLFRSIDELRARDNTLYIPAFQKIYDNYKKDGRANAGKVVIFLSDGEPWDRGGNEEIFKEAKRLIDEGICIYAIGYGEEITPGSKPEQILKTIARMSQESSKCGSYKYSPSDQIKLLKIFGTIYSEALGEINGLKLDILLDNKAFDNETLDIRAGVYSGFNGNSLPGQQNGTNLCSPPAYVNMKVWRSGRVVSESRMVYVGDYTGYQASLGPLHPGKYRFDIRAQSETSEGKSCSFIGQDYADIVVSSTRGIVVDWLFVIVLITLIILFIILLYSS